MRLGDLTVSHPEETKLTSEELPKFLEKMLAMPREERPAIMVK